MKSMAHVLRD